MCCYEFYGNHHIILDFFKSGINSCCGREELSMGASMESLPVPVPGRAVDCPGDSVELFPAPQ